MTTTHIIAAIVLIVGGLNWGLIGLTNYNLVEALFGSASRLIYVLVGLAAVIVTLTLTTRGENAALARRDRM